MELLIDVILHQTDRFLNRAGFLLMAYFLVLFYVYLERYFGIKSIKNGVEVYFTFCARNFKRLNIRFVVGSCSILG